MDLIQKLTPQDFLTAFGAPSGDIDLIAAEAEKCDFSYHRLSQAERDGVILSILRKLDSFTVVGEHRHNIWEMAWGDVAARYDANQDDLSSLVPSFIGGTDIIRLNGDYARPSTSNFEFGYFRVLRSWLYQTYLKNADRVFEFGCGSGFNLVALAQMAPEKQLVGLDWATSACDLINRVAQKYNFNLQSRRFDFFHPSNDVTLGAGSVAMTFCALEQTGDRCTPFIDWLLERKPDLVISMEPVFDFYDPDTLFDDMVIRYHSKRKYLQGYYHYLTHLEKEKKIKIIKARRLQMGSLYHEGYSLLIWKPL
jgi:SAM-dependent methyltransferase